MPGAIPARRLVIEIADFHNKIGHLADIEHPCFRFRQGARAPNVREKPDFLNKRDLTSA